MPQCPSCGREALKEDCNSMTGKMYCRFCNALFNIPASAASAACETKLPAAFALETPGEMLIIKWRWYSVKYIGWAVFAVLFCALALLYVLSVLDKEPSFLGLVLSVVFSVPGIVLGYMAAAGLCNSTEVRVLHDRVRICHVPLPYPGERTVPAADVRELFVYESARKAWRRSTCEVWLALKDNSRRALVKKLDEPEQALFIKRLTEKYLGRSAAAGVSG